MKPFQEYLKEELYQVDEVDKKTGKPRKGIRYKLNPKDKPTAVIIGKFSPLHLGHLKMLDVVKKAGIDDVILFSPAKDDSKDSDANLFTNKEKDFLNEEILKGFGLSNVKVMRGTEIGGPPQRMLIYVIENSDATRPVLVAGTDRVKDYSRFAIPFDRKRTKVFEAEKDKFEMLVDKSRDSHGMSATEVREMIRNKDLKGLTSEPYKYPPKIAKMLIKMAS